MSEKKKEIYQLKKKKINIIAATLLSHLSAEYPSLFAKVGPRGFEIVLSDVVETEANSNNVKKG